jgi:hypothetical protein
MADFTRHILRALALPRSFQIDNEQMVVMVMRVALGVGVVVVGYVGVGRGGSSLLVCSLSVPGRAGTLLLIVTVNCLLLGKLSNMMEFSGFPVLYSSLSTPEILPCADMSW